MRIRIESRDCAVREISEDGYLDLPDNTLEAFNVLAKIGRFHVVSAEHQIETANARHEMMMADYAKISASYAAYPAWGMPPAPPIPPNPASFETYLVFETDYD